MKLAEWTPLGLLVTFAAAWLMARGTSPVPFWAVLGWSLGLALVCLWIGVSAGMWWEREGADDNDDMDDGSAPA
jgi:hypothetical protein